MRRAYESKECTSANLSYIPVSTIPVSATSAYYAFRMYSTSSVQTGTLSEIISVRDASDSKILLVMISIDFLP